jgi:hypothetical protein
MNPLTTAQRRALHLAARKGGTPTGTKKGTIRVQVANVLHEHEWVTVTNKTVLITRAGRAKLNEPIPENPDVWLRVGDGLTTNRKDAVVDQLILDAHTLQPFWKEQALRNKAETRSGREHARQLRRTSRNWPTSGPCGPVVVRFEDDEAA